MICPKCGQQNDDNWPLNIDGVIKDGGCQECWEQECSDSFWEFLNMFSKEAQGEEV